MKDFVVPLIVLLQVFCTPLKAQEARSFPPFERCDTTVAGGTIRGVVLNDSTGKPVHPRAVFLLEPRCIAHTREGGRFEFTHVPPGARSLVAADLGYRRFHPIVVEVQRDSVVEVELRLQPQNLVLDCLEVAVCARVLTGTSPGAEHLSDEERLQEAVFRTSIALAGGAGESMEGWVPCVKDAPERVRVVLKQRFPQLAPATECVLPDEGRSRQSALVHRLSGLPAREISVGRIERTAEGAVSTSSYYVGPLHAQGWRCYFRQVGGQWQPYWCGTEWIS